MTSWQRLWWLKRAKLFLWTILILKVSFTFMFNLNFKIYLKPNFKFISTSISFENQFKFYFIPFFYFKFPSKGFLFYFLFYKINLNSWPISTNMNLVHGLFLDFYERSYPLKSLYTQLCLQHMAHWCQSHLVRSLLFSLTKLNIFWK